MGHEAIAGRTTSQAASAVAAYGVLKIGGSAEANFYLGDGAGSAIYTNTGRFFYGGVQVKF